MTIEQDNKWAQKFPNGEFYAYSEPALICIGHCPRKPIPSRDDEGCHIILQPGNGRGVERYRWFPVSRSTMRGIKSFKSMEEFERGCSRMGIPAKMVEIFKNNWNLPMPMVHAITFG
jgi:hypothetical protein